MKESQERANARQSDDTDFSVILFVCWSDIYVQQWLMLFASIAHENQARTSKTNYTFSTGLPRMQKKYKKKRIFF